MAMKRPLIAVFAILVCLTFAWATGAGRPYPVSAGGVIDPTCTSSSPCIEYDNNGTGPGIRGISVAGNGLAGSTKNHSTSTTNGRAGLIGNDIGTGSFNSGVHGLSVNGTGVSGQSTNAVGVSGTGLAVGVSGDAPFGVGVRGDTGDGIGVRGGATNGTGVLGSSTSGVGVNAVGGVLSGGVELPALSIVADKAGGTNNDLIDGCSPNTANPCDENNSVFRVDAFGGVYVQHSTTYVNIVLGSINIAGEYLKNNFCVAGCTAATTASTGRAVTTYAPQVSQPTIEDFGEAQIVNGQASVRLDPKFANVVEQSSSYLVFITPEGDANTLYVTQKSRSGFIVRESHAGRSTMMFSYRIVAKPFGSHEARLPMAEVPRLHSNSPGPTRRTHS